MNVKIAGPYYIRLKKKLNAKDEQLSVLLDPGTQPKHLGAAVVEMRSGNILGVTRFVQVLHEQ